MHLLAAQPGGFVDDAEGIVRIEQDPADIVILSAADTTLTLLAGCCPQADFPSVRLANLLHLRQPAAVDLYLDDVLQHACLIVIDMLGGEGYWPYGCERIMALCQARGIALVMFSGDATEDPNLLAKSSVDAEIARTLWRYLREGGRDNARHFFAYLGATFFDHPDTVPPPRALPQVAVFHPDKDIASVDDWQAQWQADAPCVLVLFYRAHLQAANTAVFSALCEALLAEGLNPLPLAVTSLKDDLSVETLQRLCDVHQGQLILNTTAFARTAMDTADAQALAGDVPVLQVILSGGNAPAWEADTQGLQPRDIAMHIAMPEVDGRIITRAVSFKGLARHCPHTQTDLVEYQPHAERMAFVAALSRRWCRLRRLPNADKRLALILANYPTREGRLGNGVGLDTPASIMTILDALAQDDYTLAAMPTDGDALMRELQQGVTNDPASWSLRAAQQSLALDDYMRFFESLPAENREAVISRWGAPDADPMLRQGRFMIAGLRCGQVFIGLQPARGYALDLMASYHDPDLVPPHHYLAFYAWLRETWRCDAVVHVGKHGNLEWLPGKSVALAETCWPDLALGPMPHLYPFIVNDPGEGTQAKRRAQAVIIDHLMPPLTRAESYGPLRDLERLVDEYYDAAVLDHRRATLLREQIMDSILGQDLHHDLGLAAPQCEVEREELLQRTDAYLCELKEAQIRDGLHIFGQSPSGRLLGDTLLALARHPVGDGKQASMGLTQALAQDLGLGEYFNPLDADWAAPWQGPRPACLEAVDSAPWRTTGDTRERLEQLALQLLTESTPDTQTWITTSQVMARIENALRSALLACGEQELLQLRAGLNGQFVPAGPSGAPSRGRPDVLPTGRNFYSVDTRAIPTQTSWQLGQQSAERLVERYMQEHGDYPRAMGLSVWGTATMRTGGDDIAQAFALMGVRPVWADGSHRVSDFEILPLAHLRRPRVDVTLRVSGFFRDAFANVMRLFDAAVQAVADLDEGEGDNPLRARVLQETEQLSTAGMTPEDARRAAGYRVFGAKPGAYGAGLQGLIDGRHWDDDADLASAYLNWGGYAYGQHDQGTEARQHFQQRLAKTQAVVQNQDNREHDLLDSDDYYQFQGGMTAAVRHFGGEQPAIYFGDHSNPDAPKIRSLEEEISRVVRSRVLNPKWIAGAQRHGYKGAFEMAATVDYLFAYDATARVVRDDQYRRVTDAYLEDPENRAFLQHANPRALQEIAERLLEAMQRGLWQAPGDYRQRVEAHLLDAEAHLERL